MALQRMAEEADFFFSTKDHDDDLRVIAFSGREALSEPFHFQVSLASLNQTVDFDAVVGQPGFLTIRYEDKKRFVNGRLLSFHQTREDSTFTYYEAELVPLLWFLRFRTDNRIFQNMNVKEIVTKALKDADVPADQFRFALQRTYAKREYCVQYGESDFDFISRLMEEEGIYYFFEQAEDKHVLVMADGPSAHVPLEDKSTLVFREYSGLVHEEEYISEWRFGQRVRSGAVVQRDFDFTKPKSDLTTSDKADRDTKLEVYDYPGRYVDKARGAGLTKVRLEGHQAALKEGAGTTNCRRLMPGYRFSMSTHPRAEFNREYLLLETTHQGAEPQAAEMYARLQKETADHYVCQFKAVESDRTFRPPPKTPKAVMKGAQTAIVVGPKGEEIHTDKHGRIKVQFHWDREGKKDENSSCWIRVSQNWAGGKYGSFFLPRINQEVVVDFLEGDPDQPIVVGRVYNGDLEPPYELPSKKTRSTVKSNSSKGGGGFNEIRFEDQKEHEQMFIHAQRNQDIRVRADQKTYVGHNRSLTVKNDNKVLIKKKDHLKVEGDQASEILGKRSMTVSGDVNETFAVNHTRAVGVNTYLKTGLSTVIESGMELTIKAVGGFIKIDPTGVTIQGLLVNINSGGAPGVGTPGVTDSPEKPDEPEAGSPGVGDK